MKENTFIFKGINIKGEIVTGIICAVVVFFVVIGGILLFHFLHPYYKDSDHDIPFYFFISLLFVGLSIGIFVIRIIGKKLSWLWTITINNGAILILEKTREHHILLEEKVKIMYVGNKGMRYLSIKTKADKIRIRIGTSNFAPYSTEKDIIEIDKFVTNLETILKKYDYEIRKGIISNDRPFVCYFWRN